MRADLVVKIAVLAERFPPSLSWCAHRCAVKQSAWCLCISANMLGLRRLSFSVSECRVCGPNLHQVARHVQCSWLQRPAVGAIAGTLCG